MKNNRKNRKLNFIRTKNGFRAGKYEFSYIEKVSINFPVNEQYLERLFSKAKKMLFKKYKISLPYLTLYRAQDGDDFIRDRITYRVVLTKKQTK